MKRTALALFVVVAGIATVGAAPVAASHNSTNCSFPFSKTDATGTEVTVQSEPTTVVAAQPSAAQTMWEIGAQDKVVGMPKNAYTSYLNGTEGKTNVVGGSRSKIVVSKVVDLNPDLVLVPNISDAETVQSLRDAGLTVYFFRDARTLEDVYAKTKLTGHLVGACDGATERANAMRQEVETIRSAVSGASEPKVFYALGGSYTAGDGTFIDELIGIAGGENIAAKVGISGYKPIEPSVIVDQNPDWIVISEGVPLPRNDAINATTAVKQNQIVRVNANYLNQAGPLNTVPLRKMAEAFHPDAFPVDTGPTATATPTATADDGSSDGSADTAGASGTTSGGSGGATATPGESGPGFTALAAMLAFVTLALVARAGPRE